MITFQQLYTEVYQGCGIPSTDSVSIGVIKRNINNALKLMKSSAGVYYTRKEVVASLKGAQQFYTFNPDMIRIRNVRVNNGSMIFPIDSIESENHWNALNMVPNYAVFYPLRWFQRGPNEVGIWPQPSTDISNALLIAYDARLQDMYLDDTVGIPITVTNNSLTITTTGTFTPNMVGQKFTFTDGSDGQWYSIIGWVDSHTLKIENYYPNATQTSSATIIGSCPDIPEEFQPGLQDYAYYRYYKTQRGAAEKANDFYNDFLRAQDGYTGTFGDKESSQIILPSSGVMPLNPLFIAPSGLGR